MMKGYSINAQLGFANHESCMRHCALTTTSQVFKLLCGPVENPYEVVSNDEDGLYA